MYRFLCIYQSIYEFACLFIIHILFSFMFENEEELSRSKDIFVVRLTSRGKKEKRKIVFFPFIFF